MHKIDKAITDYWYNIITTYCKLYPYDGEQFYELRIMEEDFIKLLEEKEINLSKINFNIFFGAEYNQKPVSVATVHDAILVLYAQEYNCDYEDVVMDYEFFSDDITCYGTYNK